MVSKKSFTSIVDTETIPIFVVVPIYFVHDCSVDYKGVAYKKKACMCWGQQSFYYDS